MGQAKKKGSFEERKAKAIEGQQAKEAAVKPEERTSLGRNSSVALALMAAVMSLPEERPRNQMVMTNIHPDLYPDLPEKRSRRTKFERRRP